MKRATTGGYTQGTACSIYTVNLRRDLCDYGVVVTATTIAQGSSRNVATARVGI
jgi:hypothetical protein